MVVFLMLAILFAGLNVLAVAGVIVAASHFLKQIRTLDIDDPDQCLALFKSNTQVGWIIFIVFCASGVWDVLKTSL